LALRPVASGSLMIRAFTLAQNQTMSYRKGRRVVCGNGPKQKIVPGTLVGHHHLSCFVLIATCCTTDTNGPNNTYIYRRGGSALIDLLGTRTYSHISAPKSEIASHGSHRPYAVLAQAIHTAVRYITYTFVAIAITIACVCRKLATRAARATI